MLQCRPITNSVFCALLTIIVFSQISKAQEISPNYGFLEVIDYKNEPVADASVGHLNSSYVEKTDQNGRIKQGIEVRLGERETPFSIEKAGFYSFVNYYDVFGFLSGGWRNNKDNPIKIELLKVPENRAEKKAVGSEQQKREFFGAARRGDAPAVRKFIKLGLSPNLASSDLRGIPTTKDVPIIMFAAKSGNGETVKEFLSAGVNVSTKKDSISNILVVYLQSFYNSFQFGKTYPDTEVQKRELLNLYENGAASLIEAGANVDSGALEVAVSGGYVRTVKKLVSKGANVNAQDFNGRTVLLTAVESEKSKKKEIIEFLLANGANPNILARRDDSYYCTSPLIFAVERSDIDLVKLLLGKKADPNLTCQNGKNALRSAIIKGKYEIVEMLADAGADIKAIDENGENNLMYAVRYGNPRMVGKMIEIGIPVNARSKQGSTALIFAISEGEMNSRLEKVSKRNQIK